MNKDKLIDKIVNKTNYPKKEVQEILGSFQDVVIKSLKKGKEVKIVGFGNFKVKNRKARKGVNPRTGKQMKIKNIKVAKFKPGKRLKEAVK